MGECADCFQNATSRKVTWTGSGGVFGTRDNAKYILDGKPDLTAARKRDSLKFGHGMQDFFGVCWEIGTRTSGKCESNRRASSNVSYENKYTELSW